MVLLLIVMSSITFLVWGFDKYRAVTQGWRVPERVLLMLALAGGGAGALAAMVIFRHKTRKPTFWWAVCAGLVVQAFLLFSL